MHATTVTAAVLSVLIATTTAQAREPLKESGVPQQLIAPTQSDPGYFVDPYPVYVADKIQSHPDSQWITGTTHQALTCKRHADASCYERSPLEIDTGPLKAQAAKAGMVLGVYDNANAYRDDRGHWHMAFTVYVKDPARPGPDGHWTVIAHAHPAMPESDLPGNWVADSILVGSLSKAVRGNYDGKYFKDNGLLYLVYSKRLSGAENPESAKGGARDGIVAQAMEAPERAASADPVVLLAPAEKGNGFNSELFHPDEPNDRFKLVETGNITRVGHIYVMAYSTGAYNRPAYKTGVAFSDTFLPIGGRTYRKVFMKDEAGVWGDRGHLEVRYLLQAAKPNWPNFIGDSVLAPGVPSIVSTENGKWSLIFAAYSISDAPKTKPGSKDFAGDHRRPYLLPLQINIPADATVQSATDASLMTWVLPDTSLAK